MPDGAFRLAFSNGLMSQSMAIWFGTMLLWTVRRDQIFGGTTYET